MFLTVVFLSYSTTEGVLRGASQTFLNSEDVEAAELVVVSFMFLLICSLEQREMGDEGLQYLLFRM